jgi:hypothetical protein
MLPPQFRLFRRWTRVRRKFPRSQEKVGCRCFVSRYRVQSPRGEATVLAPRDGADPIFSGATMTNMTSTTGLRLRDARSTKFVITRAASGQKRVSFSARRVGEPLVAGRMPAPRTVQHSALHEAGHAVALAKGSIRFDAVELIGVTGGRCRGIVAPTTGAGLEAMVVATLAGSAASNVPDPFYPGADVVIHGASDDWQKASALIATIDRGHAFTSGRELMDQYGLSAEAVFEERAMSFVRHNDGVIRKVANALLARSSLSAAEVRELVA